MCKYCNTENIQHQIAKYEQGKISVFDLMKNAVFFTVDGYDGTLYFGDGTAYVPEGLALESWGDESPTVSFCPICGRKLAK